MPPFCEPLSGPVEEQPTAAAAHDLTLVESSTNLQLTSLYPPPPTFFFLAALCHLLDLSSLTRNWTWALGKKCYQKHVWGLAACHSKADNQARLYFRCRQLGWGRVVDISPKADSTPPLKKGVRAFIDGVGGGATCRNSTVISNSQLQTGHQWYEQNQLDCIRCS